MPPIAFSPPTATKKIWTDTELMALTDGKCYELVNGELIDIGNSGALHGYTCTLLVMALMNYILPRELGIILDSSTAFTMKNGNKRSPDISFVSRDKLKGLTELPDGFLDGAPDIAYLFTAIGLFFTVMLCLWKNRHILPVVTDTSVCSATSSQYCHSAQSGCSVAISRIFSLCASSGLSI